MLDGVVLLAEHAAAVAAVADEANARADAAADAKDRDVATRAWRRLLHAALARVRLGQEHGEEGGGPKPQAQGGAGRDVEMI